MADMDRNNDDLTTFLEAGFFEAGQRQTSRPSGALMGRVVADAARVQAGFAASPHGKAQAPGWVSGWARQLTAALGGWPGMGGLAAACAAGIWLGYAPPVDWPDPANMVLQTGSDLDLIESQELAFVLSVEEG